MSWESWQDVNLFREKPVAEINVTPLVDVMLVLLVIFIITAPLLSSSLNIDLPKAEATQARSTLPRVQIAIMADGGLLLNQKAVTLAALKAALQEMAKTSAEQEVLIQADRKLPYGVVLAVMGTVQATGWHKIGFVAEPAAPHEPGASKTQVF